MADLDARIDDTLAGVATYVELLAGIKVREGIIGEMIGAKLYDAIEADTDITDAGRRDTYRQYGAAFGSDLDLQARAFRNWIAGSQENRAMKRARDDINEEDALANDGQRYWNQGQQMLGRMRNEFEAATEQQRVWLREELGDNPNSIVHQNANFNVATAYNEMPEARDWDEDYIEWRGPVEARINKKYNYASDDDLDL